MRRGLARLVSARFGQCAAELEHVGRRSGVVAGTAATEVPTSLGEKKRTDGVDSLLRVLTNMSRQGPLAAAAA